MKHKVVFWGRAARVGTVILVLFMAWLLQRDLVRSRHANERVEYTREVLRAAAKARESAAKLDSVVAAERLQAMASLADSTDIMLLLSRDHPVQHSRAQRIAREAAHNINVARQTVAGRISLGHIEAAQALSASLSERLAEFQEEERRLLGQRRELELREERLGLVILGALVVLCAALAARAHFVAARHRRALERVEQQMRDLVEHLPLAAWQVEQPRDGQSRFLYLSPAAERERGWDAAGLEADYSLVTSTISPQDRERVDVATERVQRAGGSFDVTYRAHGKDGHVRWIHSRAHVRPQPNGSLVWSGYWRDVSREVAIEQELKHANRQLQAFSHTVSHDLRTPLAAVMAFTSAAAAAGGSELASEVREYLDKIQASGAHMQSMIEALLALSRLSVQPLARSNVDLGQMVNDEVELLRAATANRQVAVTVQDGLLAEGDPALLRQVVANLLGNAWKFTSKTAHATIAVGRGLDAKGEHFFVRDNGVGFDPEHEDKLFRPFQRLHRAADFPGSGVGLATVARIIERHGGRIWTESALGAGACFYFSLPAVRASDQ